VAAAGFDGEALAKSMQQKEIEVTADLRLGNGEATVTTVDLTPGYIDENMRTS
jgi:N-acetylglutamate synthase/N-acetylornithine aminotransferase